MDGSQHESRLRKSERGGGEREQKIPDVPAYLVEIHPRKKGICNFSLPCDLLKKRNIKEALRFLLQTLCQLPS
ncbi:Activity-Dependent Neuroprotector Homeobox Protein [Manis pentadactyla]|nr:Activity-Dependent Neuroprotector Homeobox Protein [Manis pentadactyla]